MKRAKPMPTTVVGDGGSCPVFRGNYNLPALAAVTSAVPTMNIHGQRQSSSESSISGTISSSTKLRRAKLATAKIAAARVALAAARLAEVEAAAELGDDASSDSNARRNADVLSDFDHDEPNQQVQVSQAFGQPVSPTSSSEGTRSAFTRILPIDESVRRNVGNTTQDDVFSQDVAYPRVSPQRSTSTAEAGSTHYTTNDLAQLPRSTITQVETSSSTQHFDVDQPMSGVGAGGSPMANYDATKSTYILNHTVNNNHEGCNYGNIVQNTQMIQHNIQSAVDTTVHMAEERHSGVINELVGNAEQVHAFRMSELVRQASDALTEQAHDHAMIIDERSQDERAKAEWAQRYLDERERVAYENQAGLAARIQQLEYELRSKDEAAARLNIQRESEARELNARLRHWTVNRSDRGSMNSACSGSDNPESDVAMATAHPRTTEYNEGVGKRLPLVSPPHAPIQGMTAVKRQRCLTICTTPTSPILSENRPEVRGVIPCYQASRLMTAMAEVPRKGQGLMQEIHTPYLRRAHYLWSLL